MRILVTGGTVFVTGRIAEYFVAKGWEVYVLNRNTRQQATGVKLIEADRHDLKDVLKGYSFDAVIDNAYTAEDVRELIWALGQYKEYVLISSTAVYPEHEQQPFTEETPKGSNRYWGRYGTDKIAAEEELLARNPKAYILRPPYIYGPMNNLYRESFVFDCALAGRKFYLPGDGSMRLQFVHIDDLCRLIDIILEKKPEWHILNLGNEETITIRQWVELCYEIVGAKPEFVNVYNDANVRKYFCFYDYEYCNDVTRQKELLTDMKPLRQGLLESYQWYKDNIDKVGKRPYMDYIDANRLGE